MRAGGVGIWDYDPVENVLFWDDQMFRLYGITRETFSGVYEAWRSGLHPADLVRGDEEIQMALRGEKEFDTEFRVVWPNGAIRNIRAIALVHRDASGKPLHMIGTNWDITDSKQAEENIREKDIQFRKLSANVSDLIFQFTRRPDGTYYVPIASEGIKNIFGCSPEDVLEDFGPIGKVIYPEDAERVISDIEYSAKHLSFFTCEFRVQIPGKPIQWIFSRSTPEKLPDGSITWYGFNADITDRKQAVETLRESEDKFKHIFEYSIIGKSVTHFNGDIQVNRAFCDMLGYTFEEMQNKKWQEFTHPDDIELTQKYIDSLVSGEKESVRFDKRYIHKSGIIVWVDLSSSIRF